MKRIGFILLFVISGYMLFAQTWVWGRQSTVIGNGPGTQYESSAVAVDAQGDAYVAGSGLGRGLVFGKDTINSPSFTIFLVKYDSSGNVQWATNPIENNMNDQSYTGSIATDNNGNIYVAGGFSDTVSFGAYRLIANVQFGSECPCIIKYAPNGNVLWAEQAIPASLKSEGYSASVTVDASGNIYVTGTFSDTLSFGLTTLISNSLYNVFTVKYDANGNLIWARQSTKNSGNGYGNSVTTDLAGNVYVTGSYTDSLSFGAYKVGAGTKDNMFLVKYSPGGNVMWADQPVIHYSVYSENEGNSVATDNAGNIYVTGNFTDTLTLGSYVLPATIPKNNQAETFLVKYAPYGNIIWAKQSQNEETFTFNNGYTIPMLVADKKDDIFMELLADTSNFTFGGYSFTIPASSREETKLGTVCMAKLDTSGKVSCASVYANPYNAFVNSGPEAEPTNIGIGTDDSGKYVYITEDNNDDTLVFGKDSLIANSFYDYSPFVARWQPCEPSNSGGGGGGGGSDTNSSSNQYPPGDCHNIYVPDVFTPSGPYNNIFYVRGVCIKSLNKFLVFDRWGNKVFESKSLNDGWDGSYGDHPMNTGTYIWYAEVTFQDGTTLEVKGNVTLLR